MIFYNTIYIFFEYACATMSSEFIVHLRTYLGMGSVQMHHFQTSMDTPAEYTLSWSSLYSFNTRVKTALSIVQFPIIFLWFM
jgi:hypothetical protein